MTMGAEHADGALAGIRVVEVANFIAGPLAGSLLADLGADVVKVESPPDRGDPFRVWADGLYSPHFQAYNRGKRSVAINLRDDDGARFLQQVTGDADVVIHNLRPATAEILGLTYPMLRARNARIVLCAVSAFGSSGPMAAQPGFDTMGQALSGLLSLVIDPEDARLPGPAMADQLAGLFAAYGILAALLQRQVTGEGQAVETSLLASALSFVGEPLLSSLASGIVPDRYTRSASSQAFALHCADGAVLAIHLSSPEKFWLALVEALSAPHLILDERYQTRAGRVQHYQELSQELSRLVGDRARPFWLSRLEECGVPCAAVHSVADVLEDPQVKALGLIQHHADPCGRPVVSVANPVRGPTRSSDPVPAPLLGQHTASVLGACGWSEAEVASLLAAGVAAVPRLPGEPS